MKITPGLQAQVLADLPPRVRKRADALREQVSLPDGPGTVALGTATVTLAPVEVLVEPDHLTCDCLLAPRCAHRAAVALCLPLAAADEEPDDPADGRGADEAVKADEPGGDAQTDGQRSGDASAPAGPDDEDATLSPWQAQTVSECWTHTAELLHAGWLRLPIDLRSVLVADLHRLRTGGLVVADRALTSVLTASEPVSRAQGLHTLLLNLWQLSRGPASPDVIGTARQKYRPIGALKLEALCAVPIVTLSGFSGVEVRFVDAEAREWSLSRVQPGDSASVRMRYTVGADWGGSSAAPDALSRSRVFVNQATASAQGRLGSGRAVRVTTTEQPHRWSSLPDGYQVVSGAIESGDRSDFVVAGHQVVLGGAAVLLGAGRGLELLSQTGADVRCLAAATSSGWQLLGLEPLDNLIQPPDELGGVWWPGLDAVTRNWVGNLPRDEMAVASEPSAWPQPVGSVGAVNDRWLQRVADGGVSVLHGDRWKVDAAWLRRAGAPQAADLLTALGESATAGSRRFDGTWEPDPLPLAQAWLALSVY